MLRKKDDLSQISSMVNDPIDIYFECISYCDINDGICISKCVEILKESES